MFNKRNIFITVFGLLFIVATTLTAQDKSSEKKADHSLVQKEDTHKCMDKIASNENMKGKMMTKMMEHTKGDSTSMMKMCKTMMDNPEMHSMMSKMMGKKDGKMMPKSNKKINKAMHESHHPKKTKKDK